MIAASSKASDARPNLAAKTQPRVNGSPDPAGMLGLRRWHPPRRRQSMCRLRVGPSPLSRRRLLPNMRRGPRRAPPAGRAVYAVSHGQTRPSFRSIRAGGSIRRCAKGSRPRFQKAIHVGPSIRRPSGGRNSRASRSSVDRLLDSDSFSLVEEIIRRIPTHGASRRVSGSSLVRQGRSRPRSDQIRSGAASTPWHDHRTASRGRSRRVHGRTMGKLERQTRRPYRRRDQHRGDAKRSQARPQNSRGNPNCGRSRRESIAAARSVSRG